MKRLSLKERATSRKFLFSMGIFVAGLVFVLLDKLSAEWFIGMMIANLGCYTAGNALDKYNIRE